MSREPTGARILVVDDEPAIVHALKTLLSREGYTVVSTDNAPDALELFRQESRTDRPFNLVISDIYMEGVDGLELLRQALAHNPKIAVIMITAYGSVDSAVQAMRRGAFDYITKPFKFDELIQTVQRALTYEQAQQEDRSLKGALGIRYYYRQLAGDGPRMRHVYQLIESMAGGSWPVLITGEPGTGKSLVAWVLHCCSGRHERPYMQVACGDDPARVQAQLFAGRAYEQAHTGTLLLENIHALDLKLQQRLLALLAALGKNSASRIQNSEAGSRKPGGVAASCAGPALPVSVPEGAFPAQDAATPPATPAAMPALDFRLIMTSEADLQQKVRAGEFLEKLYYRLAAVPIALPPLRARLEDLPILIQHFLNRFEEGQESQVTVDLAAIKAMEDYPWPGNVAELRDTLDSAAGNCKSNLVTLADLPAAFQELAAAWNPKAAAEKGEYRWRSLRGFLKTKEREYVEQVLTMTNGDRARAASILGISLEAFNLKYPE